MNRGCLGAALMIAVLGGAACASSGVDSAASGPVPTAGPTTTAPGSGTGADPLEWRVVGTGDGSAIMLSIPEAALFATASAQLNAAADDLLKAVAARILASWPGARVEVHGHADSRPGPYPASNDELAQRRSEEVVRVLREKGLPASQLHAVGHGSRQPVAAEVLSDGRPDPQGQAANRRAEIVVIPGA